MLGLLVVATGGVFVLVNQQGSTAEISHEVLLAGVDGVFEASLQTEKAEPAVSTSVPSVSMPKTSPPAGGLKPAKAAPTPIPIVLPPAPVPVPLQKNASSSELASATESSPSPPPPTPAVPSQQVESIQPPPPPPPAEKININTANLEELDQITGVGPAIAQRIIDYRNTNGLFYQIEDLKNVSGIGDVNFEKMKDEITVGNVIAPSPTPPPPQAPEPEKININKADKVELMTLWRVGSTIADRIIEYRGTLGPFKTIEEIMDVQGIGEGIFERIKGEITI